MMLSIISRYWGSGQNNEKYYLIYEKINMNDFNDQLNGIYVFSSDKNTLDTDDFEKNQFTLKIPNTTHPISKLDFDVNGKTLGIVWASPLREGGFRITLSKSFFDTPFVTCTDYVDEKDALEVIDLKVDSLKNTIVTYYNVRKRIEGKEIIIGDRVIHHAPPTLNPSPQVSISLQNNYDELNNS
jgi:hypothetical protein